MAVFEVRRLVEQPDREVGRDQRDVDDREAFRVELRSASGSIVRPYSLTSGVIRMKPPFVAVASMKSARSAREIRAPVSRPIAPAW